MFRLPGSVIEIFQASTGWKNNTSLVSPELYIVEPGLNDNNSFNGSLIFTLNGGLKVQIPSYEMAGPLRGIDPTGHRILQSNVTTVNIFDQGAPLNTATLGKVFLSQESIYQLTSQTGCLLMQYLVISDCQLSYTTIPAGSYCIWQRLDFQYCVVRFSDLQWLFR